MRTDQRNLLIVDDEIMVIRSIMRVLDHVNYNFYYTVDPLSAEDILRNTPIDVMISDQRMPNKTGLDLLKYAKEISPSTIRILMSGFCDIDIVISAINDGQIYQYIAKPWDNEKLVDTVSQAVKYKTETDEKERIVAYKLEDTGKWNAIIDQLNMELEKKKENTIHALQKVLKAKDYNLFLHSERVAETSIRLADIMELSETRQEYIRSATMFHDIGKISIRDKIMYKDSSLDDEEFAEMKNHPSVGAEILREVDFMEGIANIVEQHHERVDGKGYPKGINGEEIMLEAQIIAVADTYEALVEKRVYRDGMMAEAAIKILQEGKGSRYNPDIVDKLELLIRR